MKVPILIIQKKSNEITIYFRFPYYGDRGFSLFKSCIRKVKTNLFVLDVMPTMLAKLKELYMKDVLNMPGMTKIALCLTILMNV